MKKHIIGCIILTICVAVCAALWFWSAEDRKVPAEMVKLAVTIEIEAKPEETPLIIFSAENSASELNPVAEIETPKADITTITDKNEPTPSSMPEGRHVNL